MVIGHLLELMRGVEQFGFIEKIANELQTHGFVVHQTTWDGQAGKTCQIGGNGVNVFQVHGDRVITLGAKFERRRCSGRSHDDINVAEGIDKILFD